MLRLKDIYTVQSYIDPNIVKEKQELKAYDIYVSKIQDETGYIYILVDGHHRLVASILDGVQPKIHYISKKHYKDVFYGKKKLKDYVYAYNELMNPINIEDGSELWTMGRS